MKNVNVNCECPLMKNCFDAILELEANKVCCCAYSIIIQTKKLSHYVIISVYVEKPQSEMMKPDDKERIIAEEAENAEKVPKIQVYTNKALTTAKKPWFPGCLGVALASFAVLLSLAVFSIVYKAHLVLFRELHVACGPSHFLKGTHCICSRSICCELCQCVDENFEGLII